MKTPEEMAEEYADLCVSDAYYAPLKASFLAGYQAAMEQNEDYKAKADKWGQELCELSLKYADKCVAYAEKCAEDEGRDAMDQVADASKVMCNTTMEEIKAVDTGELIPITNLPTPAKWISVKDRLPELGKDVLVLGNEGSIEVRAQVLRKIAPLQKYPYSWINTCSWINTWGESADYTVTHWMEIPEPPKEEK